jgi:hypothetical protein
MAHRRNPNARVERKREIRVADEERPLSLFDDILGDEKPSEASSVTESPDDFRSDTGDWLERRADIPRTQASQSSGPNLQPPPTYKHRLQSPKRIPLVSSLSNLESTESGLHIIPVRWPLLELEGSPVPIRASDNEIATEHLNTENRDFNSKFSAEIDDDERALSEAIERSLKTNNRYTANGTNLEELRQALANSEIDKS